MKTDPPQEDHSSPAQARQAGESSYTWGSGGVYTCTGHVFPGHVSRGHVSWMTRMSSRSLSLSRCWPAAPPWPRGCWGCSASAWASRRQCRRPSQRPCLRRFYCAGDICNYSLTCENTLQGRTLASHGELLAYKMTQRAEPWLRIRF